MGAVGLPRRGAGAGGGCRLPAAGLTGAVGERVVLPELAAARGAAGTRPVPKSAGNLFVPVLLGFIFKEAVPFSFWCGREKLLAALLFFAIAAVTFVYLISVFFFLRKKKIVAD